VARQTPVSRFLTVRLLTGGSIIAVVLATALLAPWLAPHDPSDQNILATLTPPAFLPGGDPAYPLGTDTLGRCILSLLMYGARVAIAVAVFGALGSMVLGATLAHLAGYFGGRVDRAIGLGVETWMSFPPVVLSLILMTGFGVGLANVILAIILVDWTRFCRVLRPQVMTVTATDYVAAARLAGFSHSRTILREVLPATLPLLLTLLSLEAGIAVIIEAILSFVGYSVESDRPAWGQMIADARQSIHEAPFNLVLPMLCIFLTVLGFNLLGDGLRRAFDVRLSPQRMT
jgi:peptide/nickel transport system permease protein